VPRYHYDVSISRQKRFIRRFKEFMVLVAGIAAVGGVVIGIDAIRQATKDDTQEGIPTTSEVRASIREFDTNYFSFTAPSGWRNLASGCQSKSYRGGAGDDHQVRYRFTRGGVELPLGPVTLAGAGI